MRFDLLAAILVAALALVAASCGGDDEEASAGNTAEWVDGFCTAVADGRETLEEITERFDDPSAVSADTLRQAADDAGAAIDQFVADVEALGELETESSEQVQSSVDELVDTVQQERTEAEQAVQDVDDLPAIAAAVASLGASLAAVGTALESTLVTFESAEAGDEVRQAYEDSDACDGLTE
jgi:methyl-accepting chemotaxis protein